jgi:hypothetical protein
LVSPDAAEPVSGRELARAFEQCVGREDLLAELQRARTRIEAGMREIERTLTVPAAKQVSSPTGKRRDRPANVAETARRAVVLERVQASEITNAEADAELGLTVATWSSWKTYHAKRVGRPGTGDARILARRLNDLEPFALDLRHRLRGLLALVERWRG